MKTCNFGGAEHSRTPFIFAHTGQFPQDQDVSAPCPRCGGTEIELVPTPENSPHYEKQICRMCDRFLVWQPKPRNRQKQEQVQATITALLESRGPTDWEREFLTSTKGKRALSPKQISILQEIQTRLGGAQ